MLRRKINQNEPRNNSDDRILKTTGEAIQNETKRLGKKRLASVRHRTTSRG